MRRLPFVLLAVVTLASCGPDDGSTAVPKTVIFFEHASAALDGVAHQEVALVAKRAAAQPAASVTVAGYAAAHGDLDADVQLAAERARVVTSLLERDGVDANRIQVIPRAPSNDNPPVASRRVEITVGGGS